MKHCLARSAVAASLLAISAVAQTQTNTLIVVADDIGIDMVGAYRAGATPPPTPTLDGLARSGVLFRRAYASPMCSPTRALMQLGRMARRTGIGSPGGVEIRDNEVPLPRLLGPAGFATALIGKWHLGGGNRGPNDAGWSHFAGALSNIGDYFSWARTVNGTTATTTTYATTQQVDDTLTWIRAQRGPWVCSLNFNAPHSPFHAPPSNLHTYSLTGNPRQNPIPHFKAAMQALDTELGRLLQGLGSAVLANTNIIFIGDNGTPARVIEAPFPPRRGKGTVYEGGINVPFIVSGPAVRSGGREVSAIINATDIFATVAELSGVDLAQKLHPAIPLDSVSLVPYLQNASQQPLRKYVVSELFGRNQPTLTSITNGTYKLLLMDSTREFYNLATDQFEQTNLLSRSLNSVEQTNLDDLLAELDRLEADYVRFGSGCAASQGTPVLGLDQRKLPQLGSTFTTEAVGLPSSAVAAIGILGFSNTTFGSIRLPLNLAVINMPACDLRVAPTFFSTLAVAGGKAPWPLPLPNTASLKGGTFYQQILVLDPQAPGGIGAVTEGGEAVVGGA